MAENNLKKLRKISIPTDLTESSLIPINFISYEKNNFNFKKNQTKVRKASLIK